MDYLVEMPGWLRLTALALCILAIEKIIVYGIPIYKRTDR
jgi:hypothetical protein